MAIESKGGGHDVALDTRDIQDPADSSAGRDGIKFPVIRLDRVENPIDRDHAVPRAIGFEVVGLGIGDRVGLLERRQIGHHGRGAIPVHPKHPVVRADKAMGAARPGQNRVQRVAHEGHVGNAAYQAALIRRGLVRGQVICDGGNGSVRRDLRNPCGKPAGVGTDGSNYLSAHSGAGQSSPSATLRYIEIAVRTELQTTGIVEARGENRHVGGHLRQSRQRSEQNACEQYEFFHGISLS